MKRLTITIKQDDVFYLAARLQEIAKKIENGILKGNELHGGGRCEFNIMDEAAIQKIAGNPVNVCPVCRKFSSGGVKCHVCTEEQRRPGDHGLRGIF